MLRIRWVACCAGYVLAAVYCDAIVVADDNPFGPVEEGVARPQVSAVAVEIAPPAVTDAPAATPNDFCRCIGEDTTAESTAHIRAALNAHLKPAGLEFTDQPLQEVIHLIQDEYGIPTKLDTAAMDDSGVEPDLAVNVNLHSISLGAALRLMLREHGLTYMIRDEVLMITTPDVAEEQLDVCVYDVRDLVDPSKSAEVESLIDTILACVATETWKEKGGGEAEIRSLSPGLLVVSQVQPVHEEVRGLLEAIRHVRRRPVVGAAAPSRPADHSQAAADFDAALVTRPYYLQISQQAGGPSPGRQIRQLITDLLPDEQWSGRLESGEPVVLAVLPDRVVVRHRADVQQKVASLLEESGLAWSASGAADGFGGGGVGGGFFNPEPEIDANRR